MALLSGAPAASSRPAVHAPGPWQRLHFPAPNGLFEGPFNRVHPAARDGAPVAAGRFPVVVLAPGLGFSAPQYTVLAADLASRGYLVVGITRTYSANLTVLHGTPVFSTTEGNPPELGGNTGPAAAAADRLIDIWADDARFAATRVAELDSTNPFVGRVVPDHVAYIGHSFGGQRRCRRAPRTPTASERSTSTAPSSAQWCTTA